MARRRRNDVDSRDSYAEAGARGDYYAQSESGMPDTRPQRRPGEGRNRHRNRGYDDRGYVDGYEPEKRGGVGKAILKFLLVLILMLLSFAGGAFGALKAAGEGFLSEEAMDMFDLNKDIPDSEDLLSSYDEDVQEAVKDGSVRKWIDELEEEEEYEEGDEFGGTTSDSPYASGTDTFDNSVVADSDNYAGSDITTNPTDSYADTSQQYYEFGDQQGYAGSTQQQYYEFGNEGQPSSVVPTQ